MSTFIPETKIKARAFADLLDAKKATAADKVRWWRPSVRVDTPTRVSKGSPSMWGDVLVDGYRYSVEFSKERQSGKLVMLDEFGQPRFVDKSGKSKPSLSVQQFLESPKTEEDGLTLFKGPDGQPILPDKRSDLFRVLELLSEIFSSEYNERVQAGTKLVEIAVSGAKKGKTPAAIHEEFLAWMLEELGVAGRVPGDIILTITQMQQLNQVYDTAAKDLIRPGAGSADVTKVVTPIQRFISAKAKKNAGARLPNPTGRVSFALQSIKEGKPTGGTQIKDRSKPFINTQGKPDFETPIMNGQFVTVDNVTAWSNAGSLHSGIMSTGICISNLGISLTAKLLVTCVELATGGRDTALDIDPEDFAELMANRKAAAVAAATSTATAGAGAEGDEQDHDDCGAPISTEALDDLMNSMAVAQ